MLPRPSCPLAPKSQFSIPSKLNKLGRGHGGDGEGLSLLLYHTKPAGRAAILIGKSPDSRFNPSPFLLSFPHTKATWAIDDMSHLEPLPNKRSPHRLGEQGGRDDGRQDTVCSPAWEMQGRRADTTMCHLTHMHLRNGVV